MPHKPVMIMAGGTGGHIYPALAIADIIRANKIPLYWLGTQRGLEARVVPEQGITLFTLSIAGIRGKGAVRLLYAPIKILISVYQALRIFLQLKPAVVLGMGGFVSGPGGVAAWLLRIPLCIHEQNSIAGLTNRLLAPLARVRFQGFPDSFPARARIRAITCGNPVRTSIADLPAPEQRISDHDDRIKLLILGGSQGAASLNRIVPAALMAVNHSYPVSIWHQCGMAKYEDTRQVYARLSLADVRLSGFIEEMSSAYAWADVVICRAGALTIAELCAAGLGAILIPYPHAVDDHQTCNARYLCAAGAAVICQETELDAKRLQAILLDLCCDRRRLLTMARNSRALARPNAARVIAEYCMDLCR